MASIFSNDYYKGMFLIKVLLVTFMDYLNNYGKTPFLVFRSSNFLLLKLFRLKLFMLLFILRTYTFWSL